jgi:hypothetical protein
MKYEDLTKELLVEYYINQKKNINEIGKILSLDGRGIWRYLKKYDIPRRKSGGTNKKSLLHKKLGFLLVEEEVISETGFIICRCLCDCGNRIDLRPVQLRSKKQSCGCKWTQAQSNRAWKGYEEISSEYWTSLKNGAKTRNIDSSITIEYA